MNIPFLSPGTLGALRKIGRLDTRVDQPSQGAPYDPLSEIDAILEQQRRTGSAIPPAAPPPRPTTLGQLGKAKPPPEDEPADEPPPTKQFNPFAKVDAFLADLDKPPAAPAPIVYSDRQPGAREAADTRLPVESTTSKPARSLGALTDRYQPPSRTGELDEEGKFQAWYAPIAKANRLNPDPDAPEHFYDYRAAYRAGASPDMSGHWPSAFKRDGHPNLIVDGVNTKTGEPVAPVAPSASPPSASRPIPSLLPGYQAPGQIAKLPDIAVGPVATLESIRQSKLPPPPAPERVAYDTLSQTVQAGLQAHAAQTQAFDQAKAVVDKATAVHQQLEANYADHKARVDAAQRVFESHVEAWTKAGKPSGQIDALNTEGSALQAQVDALNGRLPALKVSGDALSKQYDGLNAQLAPIVANRGALSAQISQLEQVRGDLNAKVDQFNHDQSIASMVRGGSGLPTSPYGPRVDQRVVDPFRQVAAPPASRPAAATPSEPPASRPAEPSSGPRGVLDTFLHPYGIANPLTTAVHGLMALAGGVTGTVAALPSAIGETAAGQDLPGHEGETHPLAIPGFAGMAAAKLQPAIDLAQRLSSHALMILSGKGGEVAPISVVKAHFNPPDSVELKERDAEVDGYRAQLGLPPLPQTARVRSKTEMLALETGRRGLDMVAKIATDPAVVLAAGTPGVASELLAGAFSASGIENAVKVASNPKATHEDVAEAVLGAAITTLPLALRPAVLKATGEAMGKVSEAVGPAVKGTLDAAKAAGRPLVLAGKLSGYGPGDISGYRGEPYADQIAGKTYETPTSRADIIQNLMDAIRTEKDPKRLTDLKDSLRLQERFARGEAGPEGPSTLNVDQTRDDTPPTIPPALGPDAATFGPEKSGVTLTKADAAEHLEAESRRQREEAAANFHQTSPAARDNQAARPTSGEPHDYSSTQVDLPPQHAKAVRDLAATIPNAALAGDGREEHPHATVLYGLHTEDADEVRKILAGEGPITVTMGKTSTFPPSEGSDGAAVLKVDLDSPDLHRLNKKLADALEHTNSFKDYKPHVTVAYLDPKVADQFTGLTMLEGRTITLHELTFSGKDGSTVTIPLGGAASKEATSQPGGTPHSASYAHDRPSYDNPDNPRDPGTMVPQYTVHGGPEDGTTVPAERLKELGIPIPEKTAAKAKPPEHTAQVPFMITRAMRADLLARGYYDTAIDKMTPAEAHAILAAPQAKGPVPEADPRDTTKYGPSTLPGLYKDQRVEHTASGHTGTVLESFDGPSGSGKHAFKVKWDTGETTTVSGFGLKFPEFERPAAPPASKPATSQPVAPAAETKAQAGETKAPIAETTPAAAAAPEKPWDEMTDEEQEAAFLADLEKDKTARAAKPHQENAVSGAPESKPHQDDAVSEAPASRPATSQPTTSAGFKFPERDAAAARALEQEDDDVTATANADLVKLYRDAHEGVNRKQTVKGELARLVKIRERAAHELAARGYDFAMNRFSKKPAKSSDKSSDKSTEKYHATQRGIDYPQMTEKELRELIADGLGDEQSKAATELRTRFTAQAIAAMEQAVEYRDGGPKKGAVQRLSDDARKRVVDALTNRTHDVVDVKEPFPGIVTIAYRPHGQDSKLLTTALRLPHGKWPDGVVLPDRPTRDTSEDTYGDRDLPPLPEGERFDAKGYAARYFNTAADEDAIDDLKATANARALNKKDQQRLDNLKARVQDRKAEAKFYYRFDTLLTSPETDWLKEDDLTALHERDLQRLHEAAESRARLEGRATALKAYDDPRIDAIRAEEHRRYVAEPEPTIDLTQTEPARKRFDSRKEIKRLYEHEGRLYTAFRSNGSSGGDGFTLIDGHRVVPRAEYTGWIPIRTYDQYYATLSNYLPWEFGRGGAWKDLLALADDEILAMVDSGVIRDISRGHETGVVETFGGQEYVYTGDTAKLKFATDDGGGKGAKKKTPPPDDEGPDDESPLTEAEQDRLDELSEKADEGEDLTPAEAKELAELEAKADTLGQDEDEDDEDEAPKSETAQTSENAQPAPSAEDMAELEAERRALSDRYSDLTKDERKRLNALARRILDGRRVAAGKPTLDTRSKQDAIADNLASALEPYKETVWAAARKTGLLNEDLLKAITKITQTHLGVGGGFNEVNWSARSGQITIGSQPGHPGKTVLKGKELVERARELLKIPLPVKAAPPASKPATSQPVTSETAPTSETFTTPGTRLTWRTGAEWADQQDVLRRGRGISSKVHRDRKSHLEELARHLGVIEQSPREDLERMQGIVDTFYKPPKGQRGGTTYEVVINAINNALQRLGVARPTGKMANVQPPASTPATPQPGRVGSDGHEQWMTDAQALLEKLKAEREARGPAPRAGMFTRAHALVEGDVKGYVIDNKNPKNHFFSGRVLVRGRIVAEYDADTQAAANTWMKEKFDEVVAREASSLRSTVNPADYKKLEQYLKALGYENVVRRKADNAVVVRLTKGTRRLKFTFNQGVVRAHNKSQAKTSQFADFRRDVAKFQNAAITPIARTPLPSSEKSESAQTAQPAPQPYSKDALQAAMNLTPDQAEATDALITEMGIDTDQVQIVKGGTPGDGALTHAHDDQPKWVPGRVGSPFENGGFWVMPEGTRAFGKTPEEAQQKLRDLGFDPLLEQEPADVLGTVPAAPASRPASSQPVAPTNVVPFKKPDVLFQGEPFYSRLQRAVELSPMLTATGNKWKGVIAKWQKGQPTPTLGKGAWTGGISRDEYAFAHVEDLEDGKTYSKADVLDYLKANELTVVPVILGDSQIDADSADANLIRAAGYDLQTDGGPDDEVWLSKDGEPVYDEEMTGVNQTVPRRVMEAFRRVQKADATVRTQYEGYAEPGEDANSYREVLLTVPVTPEVKAEQEAARKAAAIARAAMSKADQVVHSLSGPDLHTDVQRFRDAEVVSRHAQEALHVANAKTWHDGHGGYDQIANPIVRIRFNIRSQDVERRFGPTGSAIMTTEGGHRTMFLEEVQPPHDNEQQKMPALLVKHWRAIAFKWALRYAAENGLDGVAWTTGAMQAKRYSLERVVDEIKWAPTNSSPGERPEHYTVESGRRERQYTHYTEGARTNITIVTKNGGGPLTFAVGDTGVVTHVWSSRAPFKVGDTLDAIVGKEIAARILKEYLGGDVSGDGLKIGGEGLKKLYDVDYPNVVNDIPAVKKAGIRVGQTTLHFAGHGNRRQADMETVGLVGGGYAQWDRAPDWSEVLTAIDEQGPDAIMISGGDEDGGNTTLDVWWDEQDHAHLGGDPSTMLEGLKDQFVLSQILIRRDSDGVENAPDTVPSIAMTPALREAVLGGQPLYSGSKGSVEFAEDGKALIRGLAGADVSTAVHEIAHVFRRQFLNRNVPPEQREGITDDDIDAAEAWAGAEDGWTVDAEEKFARGYERYVYDGVSPSVVLAKLFAKLSAWLKDIYTRLKGSEIDLDISPAMRELYDKIAQRSYLLRTDGKVWGESEAFLAYEHELETDGEPINVLDRFNGLVAEYPSFLRDGDSLTLKDLQGFARNIADARATIAEPRTANEDLPDELDRPEATEILDQAHKLIGRELQRREGQGDLYQRPRSSQTAETSQNGPASKPAVSQPAGTTTSNNPSERGERADRAESGPIVFRSGNTRAPADLEGYIKAGQPVGINHDSAYQVRARAAAYARADGKVFVDSGAFGQADPDFKDVFKNYNAFLDHVSDGATRGVNPYSLRANVYLVAPDKVGDPEATAELQKQFGDEIEELIDRGGNVIVPVQISNHLTADVIDVVNRFPQAIVGIPANKAAITHEQLSEMLQKVWDETGERGALKGKDPRGFHLLGMGEKNSRFDAFVETIHKRFPLAVITADSNRTRALMAEGRPAHTEAKDLTDARSDEMIDREWDGDTTEIAGNFFRGDFDTFTKDELTTLAARIGETRASLRSWADQHDSVQDLVDSTGLEDALMLAINKIAKARMVKAAGPGARTDAIAKHDAKLAPASKPATSQSTTSRAQLEKLSVADLTLMAGSKRMPDAAKLAAEILAERKNMKPAGDDLKVDTWGHASGLSLGAAGDWYESVIEARGPVRVRTKNEGEGWAIGIDRQKQKDPRVIVQFDNTGLINLGKLHLDGRTVEPAWRGGNVVTKPGTKFGEQWQNEGGPEKPLSPMDAAEASLRRKQLQATDNQIDGLRKRLAKRDDARERKMLRELEARKAALTAQLTAAGAMPEGPRFAVGDTVEKNSGSGKGQRYTVQRIEDDNVWMEGPFHVDSVRNYNRVEGPAASTLKIGDRVDSWQGKGTIESLNDENVRIYLEDEGEKRSKWMIRSDITPIGPKAAPASKSATSQSAETPAEIAQRVWDGFNASERHGVSFGLFPAPKMAGIDSHDVTVALMAIAAKAKDAPAPSTGESPRDRFLRVYTLQLQDAIRNHPGEYNFPIATAPTVAAKMADALAKGSANTKGRALQAASKVLGIAPTSAGWKAYFAPAAAAPPASKPATSQSAQTSAKPEAGSWKAEMQAPEGDWNSNGLRFATKEEAERSGRELLSRWMGAKDSRAVESPDPVTHRFVDGENVRIEDTNGQEETRKETPPVVDRARSPVGTAPSGGPVAEDPVKAEAREERAKLIADAKAARAKKKTDPKILNQEAPKDPAFKAWFKDSKVVDRQGRPRVVYHATDVDFSEFQYTEDIGFHFGIARVANARTGASPAALKQSPGVEAHHAGQHVIPVYLSIQHPLRLPDLNDWTPGNVLAELEDRGIITGEQADEADLVDRETVRDWLAAKGYDGIVYLNRVEAGGRGGDSYIVFDSTQIKSATGNRGTFDPNEPNILYQLEAPAYDADDIKAMLAIIRTYKKEGITDFGTAIRQFQEDWGDGARDLDRPFELAWKRFFGQDLAVADYLSESAQTSENAPADLSEALARLKALEQQYGIQNSRTTTRVGQGTTPTEWASVLADIEAELKEKRAEIDARDAAKEAEKQAARAKLQVEDLATAKELQAAGKLVWRTIGTKPADMMWRPIAGKPVTIVGPGAEGLTFSIFKNPDTKLWTVIENTTGMGVGEGDTQILAAENAATKLSAAAAKMPEILAKARANTPVNPHLAKLAEPDRTDDKSAPLHLRIFDYLRTLAIADVPKNPVTLRNQVAEALGVPVQRLEDDIDALNDAVEATWATGLRDQFVTFPDRYPSLTDRVTAARGAEETLPRGHRTLEKSKLQQFSTPLPIGVLAAAAAQVEPSDFVLEPTAGTGNLLAGVTPQAEILAIEVAPRRAELLTESGYNVATSDYMAYPFADVHRPTVIITNPPWGKYSTGKYGRAIALGFNPTDVAERFVGKNLRDLAEGGRLVAVMPTTMFEATSFKNWLKNGYTVRAIIKSPPGSYDTRATTIDSVLLVVDKIGASGTLPAVIDAPTWEAYIAAVEALDARAETATGRPTDAPRPHPRPGPGGRGGRGGAGGGGRGGRRDAPVGPDRDADLVADREDEGGRPPLDPDGTPEGPTEESAGEPPAILPGPSADLRAEAAASGYFAPYTRRSAIRGQPHPKLLVEARQLAGVPYPPLTVTLTPTMQRAVTAGRVSVEQAEQALAALQANSGEKPFGYLAADAVGVGKSREIAMTILGAIDRAKAAGKPLRLMLTTKSRDNVEDLLDEIHFVASGQTKAQGGSVPFEVYRLADDYPGARKTGNDYEPLPTHVPHAVYVVDSFNVSKYRQALVDVGLHGIVGDEVQRFTNHEAQIGAAWVNLHARIMRGVPRDEQFFAYFTATPAQKVEDYAYLYGLRLWPIDGFNEWIDLVTGGMNEEQARTLAEQTEAGTIGQIDDVISSTGSDPVVGGDADGHQGANRPGRAWGVGGSSVFSQRLTPAEGEQIPREWKMLGRFSARDLWRAGTTFEIHEFALTPQQTKTYNQFTDLAVDIVTMAQKYGLYDKSGQSAKFGVTGMLQFAAKRIQMQPALEEALRLAKKFQAEGYQPVLSVINVSEMTNERGHLVAAIDAINTRVIDVDPDDPHGGVVDQGEIPEAIVDRARLMDRVRDLGSFADPVEAIAAALGQDKVAFIIGKEKKSRRKSSLEFQSGNRPYAVISGAGATGINLDQRVRTAIGPGHGKRVFLDVQYEWSAMEGLQRYGRVDRASSIAPPRLVAITSGNAAEKKFLATIANRMAALGALSKGGAESTGAAGHAMAEFEITGDDALSAARQAYAESDDATKRSFATIKSAFRNPARNGTNPDLDNFDPYMPRVDATGVSMSDFQLPLLLMPMEQANAFWDKFIQYRDELRAESGEQEAMRSTRFKGEILATAELKPNLKLYTVQNEEKHRFGVLVGLITPEMPRLVPLMAGASHGDIESTDTGLSTTADVRSRRRYVTFTTEDTILAGLQIPFTRIPAIAEAYGALAERPELKTAAQVLAYLKAGERVVLGVLNPDNDKPWTLRLRRSDDRILIENARMADRTLLTAHGAGYSPVGNYWHVTDLEKFLERWPVPDQVEAPAAPPRGGTPPASSTSGGGGFEMQSTLIPGAKAFVDQDVTPAMHAAAEAFTRGRTDLRTLFAPDTMSTDAQLFTGSMRANLAAYAQKTQRARKIMNNASKSFDAMAARADKEDPAAIAEFLAFTDVMDGIADLDTLPPALQDLAKEMRRMNRRRLRQIQRLGRLRDRDGDNYFGRIWKTDKDGNLHMRGPAGAAPGRRPLQGRGKFLRPRTWQSMREGVELGATPETWNPVEMFLLKLAEQDKWITGRSVLREGKQLQVARFVRVGAKNHPPAGWTKYHESFGTVYGPPTVNVKEAYDKKLMEGLFEAARRLGVRHVRKVALGGQRWGYAVGSSDVTTKVGGIEGILMHELGHILDERYGLRQQWVKDPRMKLELRNLADLREAGNPTVSPGRRRYLRKGEEKIANLLHAFLYVPDVAQRVAPNAYRALRTLIGKHAELRPLLDLQQHGRSLTIAVNSAPQSAGGLVIQGHYYGPPEAVRILDNYLSPGFQGTNIAFDTYRQIGNFMNQVQLGIPGFHMTMTGIEAMVTKFSQGLQELSRGEVGYAAKSFAEWPVATLTTFIKGNRAMRQLYAKDGNALLVTDMIDQIVQAGGGIHRDQSFKAYDNRIDTMLRAFRRGNVIGGLGRAPFAAIELGTKVTMEWWVPRLKLGAFLDLARMELRTLGPEPTLTEMRRVLGGVQDSIDNRFGQLIYDNLFWKNTLKQLGQATFRSLGWNTGTTREVFGAPLGQAAQAAALLTKKPVGGYRAVRMKHTGYGPPGPNGEPGERIFEPQTEPWLTHKGAYVMGMVFTLGLMGALFQLYLTGDGPKSIKDLYYPRTGRKRQDGSDERVSFPSYMKDVVSLWTNPLATLGHKLQPELNYIYEILSNEDFYGTQIRDKNDPILEQAKDEWAHTVDTMTPFGVQNFKERLRNRGNIGESAVESFFGVTPAPASIYRTKAQDLMQSYLPPLHRTKEQAAAARTRGSLRDAIRRGNADEKAAILQGGTLTSRQIGNAEKAAGRTPTQEGFLRLTADQALDVYQIMTPEERTSVRAMLGHKSGLIKNAPLRDQPDLWKRYRDAYALPVAAAK